MPTRRLPSNPRLEHLRNQARDLHRLIRASDADALALVDEHHPRAPRTSEPLTLAEAQLVIARTYGFPSWPRLRRHLDVIEEHARSPHEHRPTADEPADEFLSLACLSYGNSDSPERWRAARELLDADPSLGTASIWTMAAAGEAEAARELVVGDPSLASRRGGPHRWEPLLYAAYSRVPLPEGRSTLEVARVLLDHGADPDAGYLWEGLPSPFTALAGAFGGGEDAVNQPPHPDEMALARLLLAAGADPNDNQALYNRMFDRSNVHLELLFEFGLGTGDGGPWRARLPETAESIEAMLAMQLQWAAEHGMDDRVRLLLEHDVDPDAVSGHPAFAGRSAHELAVRTGHTVIADLLAAAGATQRELTPEDELVAACMRLDRAAASRLVATDPGLVGRADEALAPAVTAAELGRLDAIRLLVDLGFDVNGRQRVTALHHAAAAGDADLVRALLELGADPELRDTEFDAPALGWARHNGHAEVAALLEPLTPSEE